MNINFHDLKQLLKEAIKGGDTIRRQAHVLYYTQEGWQGLLF